MIMRILIVDDHAVVRRGVEQLLLAEWKQVELGRAESPAEAIRQVDLHVWDVVILDLSLGGSGGGGLELMGRIKQIRPRTRVLVFTMFGEEQLGVRAIQAGADGYVTKNDDPARLIDAVRRVLAGGRYISATLAERLADAVTHESSRPIHQLLSAREYEVLRMLTAGRTASEIAAALDLSIKTVSTYRARILEKMQMSSTAELIRYAIVNNLFET